MPKARNKGPWLFQLPSLPPMFYKEMMTVAKAYHASQWQTILVAIHSLVQEIQDDPNRVEEWFNKVRERYPIFARKAGKYLGFEKKK